MPTSDAVGPSVTARRVAAYRIGFERPAAPTGTGDPDADGRLARDVAAGVTVDRSSAMCRYLRARTAFFDRVTVDALSRHVSQIVLVGAGYDGRALRYATPGVRWWEIDRPVTQADKRSRLSRLGISADNVTFLPLDLADGGVASALVASGLEPDAPSLYMAEGLFAYLESGTVFGVLRELRSLATLGTRLAVSLRVPGADALERARFDASVAALGEPAVGTLGVDDADVLLARSRWRRVELTPRATAAGFLIAAPVPSQSAPEEVKDP